MDYSRLMTSNSISTNKTVFFVVAISIFGCKESETQKSTGARQNQATTAIDTLYTRCTAEACSLFTITKEGKEAYIDEGSRATTIARLTRHIYRATSSCGSPCSATLYFDTETGRKGGFFPDVVAVDTINLLVAHMEDSSLVVECIFPCGGKPALFHPALGPAAAPISSIQSAHFEDGLFIVNYLKGADFDPAVDTFTVPPGLKGP